MCILALFKFSFFFLETLLKVNESVEPHLMRYPVHYKTAIDKLLKLKDDEWLQLVDFELPAEEAIQFAVSLWAEGLLEPKEA